MHKKKKPKKKMIIKSFILTNATIFFCSQNKNRYTPMDTKTYQLPDPTWQWVSKEWMVDMSGDVDEGKLLLSYICIYIYISRIKLY